LCGICGYVGNKPAAPILIEMLKIMETYKLGYESVGIATIENGKIMLMKNVGKVREVFLKRGFGSEILKGTIGIGHIRHPSENAPVGKRQFAHPFLSCEGNLAFIHNGTIVNYEKIRETLGRHIFSSLDEEGGKMTDSEVILHLLEEEMHAHKKDMVTAIKKVCVKLAQNPKNIFLFAFIHGLYPKMIFAVSGCDHENKRKLVVAHKTGFGTLFASYREKGIKCKAVDAVLNGEKDNAEILDYGTLAILKRDGYQKFKIL